MFTRRMLIAILGLAASVALVAPASADNSAKSCTANASSTCDRDASCDPECCELLASFCCAAKAAAKLADLTETQAADVKALRDGACDAVGPHAKRMAAARREMRDAAAKSDAAAVRAHAATLAEATADGLLAAEQFTTKLVASLTPEQRTKVETAVACAKK